MSWERPDDYDEYSRGYIHVAITFEVASSDYPENIAKEIEKFIATSIDEKNFPYEKMKLHHIEMDGTEIEYADWNYEDRINYWEDCREKSRE